MKTFDEFINEAKTFPFTVVVSPGYPVEKDFAGGVEDFSFVWKEIKKIVKQPHKARLYKRKVELAFSTPEDRAAAKEILWKQGYQ